MIVKCIRWALGVEILEVDGVFSSSSLVEVGLVAKERAKTWLE